MRCFIPVVIFCFFGYIASAQSNLRNGDIVFQTSLSSQSKAIQLATHSTFSHCGLVYKKGNELYVLEAVEPVKLTPLNKWIARGKDGHYEAMRLKQALTPAMLASLQKAGATFLNKHYDIYFEWADDKIYCSELVWKVYKNAIGLEVGKLEQLRDFDLTNPVVKQKMKERYGSNIPLDEKVISPADIYNSELLMRVE